MKYAVIYDEVIHRDDGYGQTYPFTYSVVKEFISQADLVAWIEKNHSDGSYNKKKSFKAITFSELEVNTSISVEVKVSQKV